MGLKPSSSSNSKANSGPAFPSAECRECKNLVALDSPQCIKCGTRNPHLHPEINRFIQNQFSHGLITDYEHSRDRIIGFGRRSLPAVPYVLIGALLSFGSGTLYSTTLGNLGPPLMAGALLATAWCAVNGSRKKFKVRLSFSGKRLRWSSNDGAYWREVHEFFVPEQSSLSLLLAKYLGRPFGQLLLVAALIGGTAHALMNVKSSTLSAVATSESKLETSNVPKFLKALLPKVKIDRSIADPEAVARGITEITKRIPGSVASVLPSGLTSLNPKTTSAPAAQAKSDLSAVKPLSQWGSSIPPRLDQVPDDLLTETLGKANAVDLADYLVPEPGYRLILGSETSTPSVRQDPPLEFETSLSLSGDHESVQISKNGIPGSEAAARKSTSPRPITTYQVTTAAIIIRDFTRGSSGDADRTLAAHPLQFPRLYKREPVPTSGLRLTSWGKTVTASWGQIGPCFEWMHASANVGAGHAAETVTETYCKRFGLSAIEIHSTHTGQLLLRQLPVSRIRTAVLDADSQWSAMVVNDGRTHCTPTDHSACRPLGILLERIGVPFEATQAYQLACDSGDSIACAALGDLQIRMNAPRSAYTSLWKSCTAGFAPACQSWGVLALILLPKQPELGFAGLKEACRLHDGLGCSLEAQLEEQYPSTLKRAPAQVIASPAELAHRRACALGITADCYRYGELQKFRAASDAQLPQGLHRRIQFQN